jgi:hypothetical protein
MSKFSKRDSELAPDVEVPIQRPEIVEVPLSKVAAATTPVELAPKVKLLTFDMYCSLQGIPERRRAGMRAFTKTTRATLVEWESIFRTY